MDEKEKMEELSQQKVSQMMKSAEDSAGVLPNITKPTAWSRGALILKRGGGRKAVGTLWQSIGSVMKTCRT